MTLAVQALKSAKRAFALLKLFSSFSGLKINVEKTEGMWLGQQKGNLQEPLGIAWPKTHVKALGIFHSYDKVSCIKANFDDHHRKMNIYLQCPKVNSFPNILLLSFSKYFMFISCTWFCYVCWYECIELIFGVKVVWVLCFTQLCIVHDGG